MSEKRHWLYSQEIPEVVEGLRLRLEVLLKKKEEPDRAEAAFRAARAHTELTIPLRTRGMQHSAGRTCVYMRG